MQLVAGCHTLGVGALKAEHGAGRNMAPFVEREWGSSYWKTPQILAIRLPTRLKNAASHQAQLGRDDHPLRSLKGVPLPVTFWQFTTK